MFSNVFASDLLRAQQTAETIMQYNSSCSDLQMACEPLLKERNFGSAEGQWVKDLMMMAIASGQSALEFTPPNGETLEQVKVRVKGFLEKMLQQVGAEHWNDRSSSAPTETSLVEGKADDGVRDVPVHVLTVTHGVYMAVALHYFVEEAHCTLPPGCDKAHVLSPNTGLCRFILTMREEGGRFELSAMRCVFLHREDHLQQLEEQML